MPEPQPNPEARRPLRSRNLALFQNLARLLARRGITPNQISLAGIAFALLTLPPFLLLRHPEIVAWPPALLAAVAIQLRLLCNLLDGLVAVEYQRATPTGGFYNEAPDRLADLLILVGFGIAGHAPIAGLAAALGAFGTAYIRSLGAELGVGHCFHGPMAKPHRMALLTAALLIIPWLPLDWYSLAIQTTLWLVVAGCIITIVRRSRHILQRLHTR